MEGSVKAALKLAALALWTASLLPVQVVAVSFRLPLAKRIPVLYHRGNCAIIGIAIEVVGSRSAAAPTLFVSNHASYLDIVVLSALKPISFVAKNEISGWPLFGLLAKLQRSVFIARRPAASARHRDEMLGRLADRDDLVLFPEGTSSDGNRVLRFNSTFFAVAEARIGGRPLTVQPVSIAYTGLKNMPMRRTMRPYFAWYGDMELARHLWSMLRLAPAQVVVEYHPPVTVDGFPNRKAMAQHCHRVVAEGVSRALCGRRTAFRGAA